MINFSEKFFHSTLFLLRLDKPMLNYRLPEKFTLHKLIEKDIDIVAAAHRSKEIIKGRLESGHSAYWLEYDQRCVNVQWYAVNEYFVWDIRSSVTFPKGSCYLFDGFTDPNYRKQGLNKGALAGIIESEKLLANGSIYSLVQDNNPMGWKFLMKFGFGKAAEISLIQIPPIRRYSIKKNGLREMHVKIMRTHNKPVCLDLDAVRIVK